MSFGSARVGDKDSEGFFDGGISEIVERIDARVPRRREDLLWRLALCLRHRKHLIRRSEQDARFSWTELENMLSWERADMTLEAHCQQKIARAYDNSGLDVVNILALNQETIGWKKKAGVEASMYAVAPSTLIAQATMSLKD